MTTAPTEQTAANAIMPPIRQKAAQEPESDFSAWATETAAEIFARRAEQAAAYR